MPRLTNSLPKLRCHKSSGHARVQLGRREFWLGPFGSEEAQSRYNELVGQWLAKGRPSDWKPDGEKPTKDLPQRIVSVSEIVVLYTEHLTKRWPSSNGKRSPQVVSWTSSLKRFRTQYGPMAAYLFGPVALQEFRASLIKLKHSQKYVSMEIDLIRRMFKWAVSIEKYPPERYQALTTVEGLRAGESGIKDDKTVTSVSDAIVKRTLKLLPATLADMVKVQRLPGMRPGELRQRRPTSRLITAGDRSTAACNLNGQGIKSLAEGKSTSQ